jgi:hypothetical protein
MVQEDTEIRAMQQVVEALSDLEPKAQSRVLEWTLKRFGVTVTEPGRRGHSGNGGAGRGVAEGEAAADAQFEHFADLLDATNPKTEDDRALVGGYWFQIVQGKQGFAGGEVNDVLKDTGKGVGNITRSMGRLESRKPAAHIRQVSKSGRSKQARKTYKLTTAGVTAVERMIHGDDAQQEEGAEA